MLWKSFAAMSTCSCCIAVRTQFHASQQSCARHTRRSPGGEHRRASQGMANIRLLRCQTRLAKHPSRSQRRTRERPRRDMTWNRTFTSDLALARQARAFQHHVTFAKHHHECCTLQRANWNQMKNVSNVCKHHDKRTKGGGMIRTLISLYLRVTVMTLTEFCNQKR